MKKFLSASLPALYLCALFAVAGAQSRSLTGPAIRPLTAWRERRDPSSRRFAWPTLIARTNTRRLLDEMIRLVAADGFEPKLTIE